MIAGPEVEAFITMTSNKRHEWSCIQPIVLPMLRIFGIHSTKLDAYGGTLRAFGTCKSKKYEFHQYDAGILVYAAAV